MQSKKTYSQVYIKISYFSRHGVIMASGGFSGQSVDLDIDIGLTLGL